MDFIFNPNKFFYDLVTIFANLVDIAVSVCNQICGIAGEGENNLVKDLFESDIIKYIFLALGMLAVVFGLGVAIVEAMRTKSEEGIKTLQPYTDYGKGMIWICVIFSGFYLVIILVGMIGNLIQQGLGGDLSLGKQILQNCFDTSIMGGEDGKIADWNALWSGSEIPTWNALKGASKDVAGTFNAWIGLLGIGVITFPLIGIVVYMGKRLMNILLLYAVSPIAFGLYAKDGGVAKTEWLKDMKGALIGGVVVMTVLQIFLMLSSSLQSLVFDDNVYTNMIYRSILLGVGAGTILIVTKAVLKYFGCDDQLLSTAGTFTPGRAFGAIKRGVSNVKNRIKSRNANGKVQGSISAEGGTAVSEQERLQAVSNTVATMRKGAIAYRQAKISQGRNNTSGKMLSAGALKPAQPIERKSKLSTMAKENTYSKPTINKPVKNVEAAKSPDAVAKPSNAGVTKANDAKVLSQSKPDGTKAMKPGKLELKIKDDKLTKAIDKLAKKLSKGIKVNKAGAKTVVKKTDGVKSIKIEKPNNIKAAKPGKKFKVSNAVSQQGSLKVSNNVTSNNKVQTVINSNNNAGNANDISNIRRELTLNKANIQRVIELQSQANRRAINLQTGLKKLTKKR